MLWPSEIRVAGLSDEGEHGSQIPSAQEKGWQSNYPFCFAIATASEGIFNMCLWSKLTLRKIKRGGINLPLAFTQTTNVTFRSLFPDASLPPVFLPPAESILLLTGTNDTPASSALNMRCGAKAYFYVIYSRFERGL